MARILALLIVSILLVSCGKPGSVEVTETRTVTAPPAVLPTAPAPKMDAMPATSLTPPGMMPQGMPQGMPHAMPTESPFTWTLPEGWKEAPATAMRLGNFKLASNPDAECYVTLLQGAAGGADANINRWRSQMGQPDLTPEDIAALPKVDVMGKPSPMVEILGSFAGMMGDPKPGYLLLGVVCALDGQVLFVKMTGPETAVAAEKERFAALCKSLKQREAASNAGAQENK